MGHNWKESADYWRNRANAFELALREIERCNTGCAVSTSNERWEIAFNALEKSKQSGDLK